VERHRRAAGTQEPGSDVSQLALVKLARIYDSQPVQDAEWVPAEKTLFQRGAFYVLPTAKLLVNHDRTREVGSVLELLELPDTDGNWLAARCRVDAPPTWLEQGKTKASFSYAVARSQRIGGWVRVLRGVLNEVSLLAPGVAPAESRAKVVLLREAPGGSMSLPAAGLSSDRPAVGEQIIYGGGLLRRPGIGNILGVR
jgi:hypothetical protein